MTETDRPDAHEAPTLAQLLGVAIRAEHLAEVAACWAMMAPHRAVVAAVELGPEAEPAALFRP